MLKDLNGISYVSVNKALVTQSSSAIPVVPLYISLLYKVMKEKGIHEGTIEQMQRLLQTDYIPIMVKFYWMIKAESVLMTGKCVKMYKKLQLFGKLFLQKI